MPFINGKWVHHNDCFWCINYRELPLAIKKGKVTHVREQCGLTDNPIPLPGTPGRYCDHYQQKECGCSNCIPIGV